VLVTGASRGIGRAIAQGCAEAGATVAVHYHQSRDTAEALASALGHGAQAFQADLTDPHAARRLWDEVVGAFGRVHALVNNAAIAEPASPEAPLDDWLAVWHRTMAANLTAVGVLCQAAVPHFAEKGGGRIVTLASRAAFRGDAPEYLAYAASKAGVVALTRSIARGYGKQGIAAFTIAPGFTRTDMAQPFIDRYGEAYATDDLALARMTEPEDIAPLVVLLASGLADHATGTTIDVNAGSYVH
ncbi:MAG: SDR family oxidoreductase, partial [Rhodothermaceae bacterium]|nr:SDR family oxidoreductase [Rhodothermaceae bacterium]